jgi:hypothetical protein
MALSLSYYYRALRTNSTFLKWASLDYLPAPAGSIMLNTKGDKKESESVPLAQQQAYSSRKGVSWQTFYIMSPDGQDQTL